MNSKNLNVDSRRKFTNLEEAEIMDSQKGKCAICGTNLIKNSVKYDYKKPLDQGGTTELSNAEVLCMNCHGQKTRKDELAKTDKHKTSKHDNPVFGKQPYKPQK